MGILADPAPDMLAVPRFDDGAIDMRKLIRRLAEQVLNAIVDAEADQLCAGGANSRNGYRERALKTCVGDVAMRIPKLRTGSFFPDDAIERYQRVDRALVAVVAEMHATGTRKVQRMAEKMGVSRLSKDQVSAIAASLDADIDELCGRPLDGSPVPYVSAAMPPTSSAAARGASPRRRWSPRSAATRAAGAARRAWASSTRSPTTPGWRSCAGSATAGSPGCSSPSPTRYPGLVRALGEVFQGAAWQRCAVHLMRDCMREAGPWQLRRRIGRILSPVFRGRDAATVTAMYHVAIDMLEACCPRAAAILEEAEPDALAYLDFPPSHWKRLRTNNVQERTNREIKRRSRVAQVFPSIKIARASGRRGHVRAGRALAGVQVLLGGEDERVVRREEGPRGHRFRRLGPT